MQTISPVSATGFRSDRPRASSGDFTDVQEVNDAALFFHVKKGDEVAQDPEGIELADETAAHYEALQAAQALLTEAAIHGDDLQEEVFIIEDENGREVMKVPFSEAARPD